MGSEVHELSMFFFPFMAPGHMIPTVDMAKLFASRGVKVTIITTPANAPLIQPTIDRANQSGRHHMRLLLLQFPYREAGLPQGCENATSVSSDMRMRFLAAAGLLREPFEQLLRDDPPDCILTDAFFPWTADVACEFGIPRLVFHGSSFFSTCVSDSLRRYAPHDNLPEDVESFVVPGLPRRVELLRSQVADFRSKPEIAELFDQMRESFSKSFGMVVNSFYEMEKDFADHYRSAMGRKAWHVGPVSLCNKDAIDKAARGDKATLQDHANCLSWLDSKKPSSVMYVCFGSLCQFTSAQLREIALGLEASNHPFIWVVRNSVGGGGDTSAEWLPEGFEERMAEEDKGLIIRGWAPQILILNHDAVGGFTTHCGWNSCLEGVSAGVPLITWPLSAEQFYNERLITDVLRVGVAVGAKVWTTREQDRELVKREVIADKVAQLMDDREEAEAMRARARELGEMARRAVEEGGSSSLDMDRLIDELIQVREKGTAEGKN